MASNENAGEIASRLRDVVAEEIHGERPAHSRLFEEFSKIEPQEKLNAVGKALEATNAYWQLSTAPQASITRDGQGDVTKIEFHPGRLDFNENPRTITMGRFGKK